MKPGLFVLLLAASVAAGCDPFRRINMKNYTGDDAEIIWTIKDDSLHSSPFFLSNSKEQKFELKANSPGNKIHLSCGIGNWTLKEVERIVDDLESLTIKWNGGEIKLDSTAQIKNFLLARRKGFGKDKIEINIKN